MKCNKLIWNNPNRCWSTIRADVWYLPDYYYIFIIKKHSWLISFSTTNIVHHSFEILSISFSIVKSFAIFKMNPNHLTVHRPRVSVVSYLSYFFLNYRFWFLCTHAFIPTTWISHSIAHIFLSFSTSLKRTCFKIYFCLERDKSMYMSLVHSLSDYIDWNIWLQFELSAFLECNKYFDA